MNNNVLIPVLVFMPMLGALGAYISDKKSGDLRDRCAFLINGAELFVTMYLAISTFGSSPVFEIKNICSLGMNFIMDDFRRVYALVTAFMWFMTTLFSKEYFAHHENKGRYYFFNMMTLGATMGVFLSSDLFTTFIFFEVMSFTSYVWVAQEEDDEALRAANTYLGVAVIGGLTALMGLFLLYDRLGTLEISRLYEAASSVENKSILYTAGGCLLFGFGAKAGMFPLHIWLPKAHPVAPAPASALLSGILTKTGVFGILAVSCNIFRYDPAWGEVILVLGVITMFLGAMLALFSIDLKRTLACSSMSQIGFILIGISMMCLLGEENALAAQGTVLHMVNHSLIKLLLFMAAGVVHMNIHKLDLNDIRGYGRNKPILKYTFLIGALGIGGMPLFNGYISKTLLHESIVEYGEMLIGTSELIIKCVEWIFLISGGLTVAYMTKLFVAIFVERNDKYQKEYDKQSEYIGVRGKFALIGSAIILPVFGMMPGLTMDKIAHLGREFLAGAEHEGTVQYFSWANLKGGLISIAIGAVIYIFVVRKLLMKNNRYINVLPKKFDLEDLFYRPLLLDWLPERILGPITAFLGENLTAERKIAEIATGRITAGKNNRILADIRVIADFPDIFIAVMRRTLYCDTDERVQGERKEVLAQWGENFDKMSGMNRKYRSKHFFERLGKTLQNTTELIMNNFSYALIMACAGLCVLLIYLLVIR